MVSTATAEPLSIVQAAQHILFFKTRAGVHSVSTATTEPLSLYRSSVAIVSDNSRIQQCTPLNGSRITCQPIASVCFLRMVALRTNYQRHVHFQCSHITIAHSALSAIYLPKFTSQSFANTHFVHASFCAPT